MEFSQLALLISVAGIFGFFAKLLKQPLLVGYLAAGFLLSVFGLVKEDPSLEILSHVGVTLLLFLLGLEMKISELPTIGKTALITGLGQIIGTSAVGFLIAYLLGFSALTSIYIAVALTFSSTIIIVKLLSEKKDLGSLYGRISVGFLLVQDLVAIIILMFLAGLGKGGTNPWEYLIIIIKAVLLISVIWVLSKRVIPKLFDKYISSSPELLFIVSISWALGLAAIVSGPLGFTLEIGGFLAGIALSGLPEHLEIASRARPLRDFFLTIFFLILGTRLVVDGGITELILPSVVFSLFVLIGNPIIVLMLMGYLGYKKRTSFFAGLTVAQISEFSMILMAMGVTLGHVTGRDVSIIVLVGIATMTISTYMILGADKLYTKLKGPLGKFERKNPKEAAFISEQQFENHIILVGSDKTGTKLVDYFLRHKLNFVVIDFNPEVYTRLNAMNVPVIYGDISDPDILDSAMISKAKLIISTTSSLSDDLHLLEYLKSVNSGVVSVFVATSREDAMLLYGKGAGYVIVPDIIAGDHLKQTLRLYKMNTKKIESLGKNHFQRLIFS